MRVASEGIGPGLGFLDDHSGTKPTELRLHRIGLRKKNSQQRGSEEFLGHNDDQCSHQRRTLRCSYRTDVENPMRARP